MSKARELAELGAAYDSGALSNRNIIINGGMEIAQRGTSSTSSGYVSLDRFYVNQSGASTTFSQETNANPSEIGGLQKYARLNVSSSSDFCHIRQPIEDVTTVPAGTVTLSFYAKGTAPAGGLYTYGIQNFGSGGSSDVDWTAVLITSTLTSDWVRYTAQITVPSLDGKTVGAGSYFLLDIGQHSNSASTAFDLNITGVQLEVGTEATPFEQRSVGDELARCERYFQTYSNRNWNGINEHAGNYKMYVNGVFRQKMRATPTGTFVGTVSVASPQISVTQRPDAFQGLSSEGWQLFKWPSSGTYGGSLGTHGDAKYYVGLGAGPTNRIDFDAEL
tara:strand:+ start:164 stop:1162 length:999 start_codon:yes stop_codon:yes gene_type:complete